MKPQVTYFVFIIAITITTMKIVKKITNVIGAEQMWGVYDQSNNRRRLPGDVLASLAIASCSFVIVIIVLIVFIMMIFIVIISIIIIIIITIIIITTTTTIKSNVTAGVI